MPVIFFPTNMDSTTMVGCTCERLLHVIIRMYFQSDQDGIDSETNKSLPNSSSNIYESISSEVLILVRCTCERVLHVSIRNYFQSDQNGIDSETYESLQKSSSSIYESISSESSTNQESQIKTNCGTCKYTQF